MPDTTGPVVKLGQWGKKNPKKEERNAVTATFVKVVREVPEPPQGAAKATLVGSFGIICGHPDAYVEVEYHDKKGSNLGNRHWKPYKNRPSNNNNADFDDKKDSPNINGDNEENKK